MISSLQPEAAEAKKQKRVLIIFGWNIFFGRTEAFLAELVEVEWPKNTNWIGELACLSSQQEQNHGMGNGTRLSRVCGWLVRPAIGIFALAFCASAFADPSKNVVALPSQPLPANTTKKICYVVSGGSRIPQRCDRLSAIPTTASVMDIYGRRPGR